MILLLFSQRRLWKCVLYYDPISGIIMPWLYSRHRRSFLYPHTATTPCLMTLCSSSLLTCSNLSLYSYGLAKNIRVILTVWNQRYYCLVFISRQGTCSFILFVQRHLSNNKNDLNLNLIVPGTMFYGYGDRFRVLLETNSDAKVTQIKSLAYGLADKSNEKMRCIISTC